MFGNNTTNNQQTNTDIDEVAKEIGDNVVPEIGIAHNPSNFTPIMPDPDAVPTAPTTDASTITNNDTPTSDDTSVAVPSIPASPNNNHAPINNSELETIKAQALGNLSPLVNKLDQSPEEKFKTLMTIIQASDKHDLISEAYEAANNITDETAKANALLAIVNEINYFTQAQNHQ